ncbi:MBL fold metallo-hydrolase [Actinosynnema sp.]|uniref:MBL fold metallo-hydrolase n=1 Tax=Actinosynnema sp. TaxID=1872144 RepID=UPI003F85543E
MRITHFGQSCLLVEAGGARLLFDPGAYSAGFERLTGLDAVLVTHQHPDHLDPARLPALLAANPGATLVLDPGSAAQHPDLGATTAEPGAELELGGARVRVLAAPHEEVHPAIPLPLNVGYLVDGFYHPGDSLALPGEPVDVLGLPAAAPWLKLSEAADFLAAIAPRVAVPIHQAVLADPTLHHTVLTSTAPAGTSVVVLAPGEPTEV